MLLLYNPSLTLFVQLTLATLFGMVLGIERVLVGRTAGPRTYGLVSLGSCLVTILSLSIAPLYGDVRGIDPIVLVSSVISGIGFIGAGLIIFRNEKLSGLTTAAGIWVASGIGIAVGFHFYLLAFFTTFLTMFIFTIMSKLENKIRLMYGKHELPLETNEKEEDSETSV